MKHLLLKATALSSLGMFAATAASANETDAGLDEIVVTAQKKEQSLIDVPINVSVMDQDLITALDADDIEDLSNFIPGLQVQAQSVNFPSYSLRGVVSDSGRPRVGIFQNGIAIGNPGYGANLANFDMERIEIVKGPQATLFNQGALVGGINFIQNRASTDETSGSLLLEGGSYAFARGEGHVNVAVSDRFAFRLAGQSKHLNGYVPNIGNSPDLMGQKTLALRGAIHWQPVDRVTTDVFVNFQQDDSTGTQFKSGFFVPEGGDLSPYTATAMNINDDQVRDKLGNDREHFYVTANVAVELTDALTLNSLTDYRDLNSVEAWDSDGALFDLLQFYQDQSAKVFNQELRLDFDNGGKVSGFIGANYTSLDSEGYLLFSSDEARLQRLFFGPVAGTFDNPVPISLLGALGGQIIPLHDAHLERQDTTNDRKTYDLFADVTVDVTDKLTVTAGGRWSKEELATSAIDQLVRGNPALGGAANAILFNQGIVFGNAAAGLRTHEEDTDGGFTWRLNAAYRVSDNINTWLAYGRGRRPEALSADGADFTLVDAETLDNVEAGMFGRFFDNRAQVTTSVYYGKYNDFQVSRFDPTTGTNVTENAGAATQYGFEFDGMFEAMENVLIGATYAYNFSEYDDFDKDDRPVQFAGNTFRISPKHSFSVFAVANFEAGSAGTISVTPSYTWKDRHFFENDNGFNYEFIEAEGRYERTPEAYPSVVAGQPGQVVQEFEDAYGLANLRIAFDSADEKWGAFVMGENLFDKEYLIDVGNIGGAFSLHTIIRGKPRMIKGGVYVNF